MIAILIAALCVLIVTVVIMSVILCCLKKRGKRDKEELSKMTPVRSSQPTVGYGEMTDESGRAGVSESEQQPSSSPSNNVIKPPSTETKTASSQSGENEKGSDESKVKEGDDSAPGTKERGEKKRIEHGDEMSRQAIGESEDVTAQVSGQTDERKLSDAQKRKLRKNAERLVYADLELHGKPEESSEVRRREAPVTYAEVDFIRSNITPPQN